MNTVTTVEAVEKKGDSYVATLLGGKKAGTTDQDLGQKLLEIYNHDPENCLVEARLETRGERLWLMDVDYIEPPDALGGPPSESAGSIVPSSYPDGADPNVDPKEGNGDFGSGEPTIEPNPFKSMDALVKIRTELTTARVALGNAMTLIEAELRVE